jgi:transposase
MSLAEQLGIKLLFLPSYSPNLNLIERLWKFVKKQCLYNVYYENFEDFKKGINTCLEQVNTFITLKSKNYLTQNFKNLKNVCLMTV